MDTALPLTPFFMMNSALELTNDKIRRHLFATGKATFDIIPLNGA